MTSWIIEHVSMSVLIFFAGLWGEVWRYSVGFALMGLCLVGWWFSPVFKKDFLYGAAVFGISTFVFAIGVFTGEQRVRAQWTAAIDAEIKSGEKAHDDAVRFVKRRPLSGVRPKTDRFERNER